MSARPSSWTTALLAVLLIAFLIGLGMANARFATSATDANEFLPRWEGANAWLTRGLSPYDPQVSLSAQRRLYGREAVPEQGEYLALFTDPLTSMILYAPWGILSYPAARAGWMTLLEVMLVVAGVLAVRLAFWRPPPMVLALLVAFGVAWSPGIRSIVDGHAAIPALVFSLAAMVCVERGWDAAGGILLALAMADPVVGLLVLLAGIGWAASRRRWGVMGGALGTFVVLAGASLLLMPGWPYAWLQQIMTWLQVRDDATAISGLAILGEGSAPVILAAVLVLAWLWAIWACLGMGTRWFVWSMVFSLVLGDWLMHLVMKDSSSVYLLPAAVLVLASIGQRSSRAGNWIVAGAVVFIGIGSWILYLSVSAETTGGILGTAIGPALAVLGLLWVRWWVTRGAEVRGLSFEAPEVT